MILPIQSQPVTRNECQAQNTYQCPIGDSSKSLYLSSQTFRGCYTGPTAYFDCDLAGFRGVKDGQWYGFACRSDSSSCTNGLALFSNP
jgi:hypothetical protein